MRHVQSKSYRYVAACLSVVLLLALPLVAAEVKIDLRTVLSGPVYNGVQPKGKGEFQSENNVNRFIVEVNNINLPNGTLVNVFANGTQVGQIRLLNQGGSLIRSTAAGQKVPNITTGSTVAVRFSGTKILGGTF